MSSFAADWRSSRAAQTFSAILAVIVVGGIGYGIGYAVGDSGHHGGGHGRHGDHHMMFRDGGGPGVPPGMHGFHMRPGGQMPGEPMYPDQGGPNMGNAPAAPASPAAPTTPAPPPAPAQP